METKTYYLDTMANGFPTLIKKIIRTIPCFYTCKPVEMDYAECTFQVRREDIPTLEKMIAPLV